MQWISRIHELRLILLAPRPIPYEIIVAFAIKRAWKTNLKSFEGAVAMNMYKNRPVAGSGVAADRAAREFGGRPRKEPAVQKLRFWWGNWESGNDTGVGGGGWPNSRSCRPCRTRYGPSFLRWRRPLPYHELCCGIWAFSRLEFTRTERPVVSFG